MSFNVFTSIATLTDVGMLFNFYLYSMIFGFFGFNWHNENNICLFQNVGSALSSMFDIENTLYDITQLFY